MCASSNGRLAIAKLLLEGGADATLRSNSGDTALDIARLYGIREVVALLSEPRYAARMETDRCMIAKRFRCGGGEAPSCAHADQGLSAARQTNGGELPWDAAERSQRTPSGATQRLAIARPSDLTTGSERANPRRRGGHIGSRWRTRGLVCLTRCG